MKKRGRELLMIFIGILLIGTVTAIIEVGFDEDLPRVEIVTPTSFMGNQYYAEMWVNNDTTGVSSPAFTQNVWANLTGFNQSADSGQSLNGFTYDNALEILTAQVGGKYNACFSLSFGNAGNNQEYEVAVAKNYAPQSNIEIHRKIGSAGDVGNAGSCGFIDLVAGDIVNLQIRNRDSTATIYLHNVNLNLIRIGS